MPRGLTEKVFIEQCAFLSFYEEKLKADPGFANKTIFIDVTSMNQHELSTRGKAMGPIGGTVLASAPSDRGVNYDFVGGISRERGLMGAYVYEGAPLARATAPRSREACRELAKPGRSRATSIGAPHHRQTTASVVTARGAAPHGGHGSAARLPRTSSPPPFLPRRLRRPR